MKRSEVEALKRVIEAFGGTDNVTLLPFEPFTDETRARAEEQLAYGERRLKACKKGCEGWCTCTTSKAKAQTRTREEQREVAEDLIREAKAADLTDRDRAVLMAILNLAAEWRLTSPSITRKRICEMTGLSGGSVQLAVPKLEKLRWFKRSEPGRPTKMKDGSYKTPTTQFFLTRSDGEPHRFHADRTT